MRMIEGTARSMDSLLLTNCNNLFARNTLDQNDE